MEGEWKKGMHSHGKMALEIMLWKHLSDEQRKELIFRTLDLKIKKKEMKIDMLRNKIRLMEEKIDLLKSTREMLKGR
jgi:hypothetical protein